MATTITSTDTTTQITMDAVVGNVEEITVPRGTRTVYIQSFDSLGTTRVPCYYADTGTDGAAIGADFFTIPEGVWVEPVGGEFVRGAGKTFYVASSVSSGILEVRTMSVIAGIAQ